MSENKPYNPHAVRRVQCQHRKTYEQVAAAIPVIKDTQLNEGQCLSGVINPNGLMLDDSRCYRLDEELKAMAAGQAQPAYPFRYDGKKLELFI